MWHRLRRLCVWLLPYGMVLAIAGAVALALGWGALGKMGRVTFHDRGALALVLGAILVAWVTLYLHLERLPTFTFSRVGELARTRRGFFAWLASLPRASRVVAVGL